MAKKIKFYLHCNGQKIANMEALRENFNLEDIVEQFQSGKLQRWLESQGFVCELEKVRAISAKGIEQVAKELLKVFELELSTDEEKDAIMDILYTQKRHEFLQKIMNAQESHQQIIKEYHSGFYKLFREILEKPTDRILIKKNLQWISEEYFALVLLYRTTFVRILLKHSPFALLLSFAIDTFEKLWRIGLLENSEESLAYSKAYGIDYEDTSFMEDIKICAILIADILSSHEVISELENHKLLKRYTNNTEGHWKELEPKIKRCLILIVDGGNVASMVTDGEVKKDINASDVHRKFLIFDGLSFQTTQEHFVLYMEL